MKKLRLIVFPVLAILMACGAVFANGNLKSTVIDVVVTADPVTCAIDGVCDQSHSRVCKLASTGLIFYRVDIICCCIAATGNFRLP
jgi:hypothetical protein